MTSEILETLSKLEARVTALEKKRNLQNPPRVTIDTPPLASDEFATQMMIRAIIAGFRNTTFCRVPTNYYELKLEQRRRLLKAISTKHLTKSLVLRDHKYTKQHDSTNLSTSQYICVVVQYGRKVDTDLLARAYCEIVGKNRPKPNFRMADDCVGITGYEPNAVTPLGLRTNMPVFVDTAVSKLSPYFWLGGGEVDLKWRVTWDEFNSIFNPLVAHLSAAE